MAEPTYDPYTSPVAVAYIGNKEIKKDTIARTGAVWNGFGDVQTVDARAATQLLKFKSVYIRADQLDEFKKNLADQVSKTHETGAAVDGVPVASSPDCHGGDGDTGDTGGDGQSAEYAEKKAAIQTAILALDPDNKDHFFGNGSPKKGAVDALLPDGVEATKEEVAAVFAELSE